MDMVSDPISPNRLISDFDHPSNETLEGLKLQRARYCGDPRHAYNRPLEFSEQLRELAILRPKGYGYLTSVALALFIGIVLAEKHLGLHIQFPIGLSVPLLIVSYFICLGLVIGGFTFLSRINPVLAKAQSHQLYVEALDNRNAAEIALRIRDRFHSNMGLDYSITGSSLSSLVALLTPWPLKTGLSIIEAAATAAAAVFALLVLYPAATVYLIYANASVAMQDLPQSRFKVDLHASNGRLGIGELIDLLIAGISFNVTALVLLWIVGPIAVGLVLATKIWWVFALYQTLIFPLALTRVAQLRRLWKVRHSVVKSVHQAVSDETKQLKGLSIAERNARQQNLARLQQFPILTTASRGRIKEIVTVVLIPLAILIADRAYTAWTSSSTMTP
jgi:hypothetical protein